VAVVDGLQVFLFKKLWDDVRCAFIGIQFVVKVIQSLCAFSGVAGSACPYLVVYALDPVAGGTAFVDME